MNDKDTNKYQTTEGTPVVLLRTSRDIKYASVCDLRWKSIGYGYTTPTVPY